MTLAMVSVGGGGSTQQVAKSEDADNWTLSTTPSAQYDSVTYAPPLDTFIAFAHLTDGLISFRRQNTTTTSITVPELNQWFGAAWSPSLAIYCAVAASGTHRVMTSPDSTTWTVRTAASASAWQAVEWSADLNLFVAVGTNVAMTSPDGIIWTSRTIGAFDWKSVVWCSGTMQKFVAVAGNRIATSTDGITWSDYNSSTISVNLVGSAAYSPSLDKVLVTIAAGSGGIATSSTGLTGSWTAVTNLFGLGAGILGACWSTALSLWVVVGSNVIGHSPDGTTWTQGTSPANTAWNRVTEGVLPPGQMGLEMQLALSEAPTLTREMTLGVVPVDVGITETLAHLNNLDTTPSRDILISWLRRDRISTGPLFVTDNVPMSEATEAYDVEILQSGSVVRTFSNLLTNSVLYTAAMQVADGWTQIPYQITVRVFQLSAVVGRGFGEGVTVDVQ